MPADHNPNAHDEANIDLDGTPFTPNPPTANADDEGGRREDDLAGTAGARVAG